MHFGCPGVFLGVSHQNGTAPKLLLTIPSLILQDLLIDFQFIANPKFSIAKTESSIYTDLKVDGSTPVAKNSRWHIGSRGRL